VPSTGLYKQRKSRDRSCDNRPAITITSLTANLARGEALRFKAPEKAIWTVKDEIGSINTKGNFKAEKEDRGQIIAILVEDPSVTAASQTITGAKLDASLAGKQIEKIR